MLLLYACTPQVRELGRGQFGSVWLARWCGVEVALKELHEAVLHLSKLLLEHLAHGFDPLDSGQAWARPACVPSPAQVNERCRLSELLGKAEACHRIRPCRAGRCALI